MPNYPSSAGGADPSQPTDITAPWTCPDTTDPLGLCNLRTAQAQGGFNPAGDYDLTGTVTCPTPTTPTQICNLETAQGLAFDPSANYALTGSVTCSDPTLSGELVNLGTLNDAIAGVPTPKEAVKTAVFTNISLAGLPMISGYQVVDNDRVLIAGQTIGIDNGIYVANSGGWYRSSDYQGGTDQGNTQVGVLYGDFSGNMYLNTTDPCFIGTNIPVFALTLNTNYSAGQGITIQNRTIAANSYPAAVHTISLSGTLQGLGMLAGYELTDGDRILRVSPDTDAGIWIAHPGLWERASDFAVGTNKGGVLIPIAFGDYKQSLHKVPDDFVVGTSTYIGDIWSRAAIFSIDPNLIVEQPYSNDTALAVTYARLADDVTIVNSLTTPSLNVSNFTTGVLHSDIDGTISSTQISNGDVSDTAGISYSKLDLSNSIKSTDIAATGVTPGAYTYPSSITVDASGQITDITSGSSPSGDILQGGNAFGDTVQIGSTDAFDTVILANNDPVIRAFANGQVQFPNYLSLDGVAHINQFGTMINSKIGNVDISSAASIDTTKLQSSGVDAGVHNYPSQMTVTAQGIVTAITDGPAPVSSVAGTANQIDITGTTSVTAALSSNTIIPGTGSLTIPSGTSAQRGTPVNGKIRYNTELNRYEGYTTDWAPFNTSTASVSQVDTGTGLTGGPITDMGTISLTDTAVTPASYTNMSATVDAQGRITAASSGTAPVTIVTGTTNQIAVTGTTAPVLSIPTNPVLPGTTSTTGLTVSSLSTGIAHLNSSGNVSSSNILNADVDAAAAIAYSKLNLSGSITNADINASAAISDSKLANISTTGKVLDSANSSLTSATDANTPSTLVRRDASGNISVGTVTGDLSGNATTATAATSATSATNSANAFITNDTSTNTNHVVNFTATHSSNQPIKSCSTFFTFNPSTGQLRTRDLTITKISTAGLLQNDAGGNVSATATASLLQGGTNASLSANNGGVVYSTAAALAILPGTPTAGKMLQSGATTAPSWSTPTYPSASGSIGKVLRSDGTNNAYSTASFADTYPVNNLLYSSAADTVSPLTTANNGILSTSGAGVPSISTTIPAAVQANITTVGNVTAGTWNGTIVSTAFGGTGQSTYTNGQFLIGNTTGSTLVRTNLTPGTGVNIVNGPGSVTISIGQDVSSAASPTFAKMNINATGAAAAVGTGTLVGGIATINSTNVTANSRIFVTKTSVGSNANTVLREDQATRVNGVSFRVVSSGGTDTSTFSWLIIN